MVIVSDELYQKPVSYLNKTKKGYVEGEKAQNEFIPMNSKFITI
jgi:hypothetical protein